MNFEKLKEKYNKEHKKDTEIQCFLPVHLTINKIERNLYKTDGSFNEQYYKWQFLSCFIGAGYCSKDFIGVEVNLPKGNKNSAHIKIDAAIFDNKNWFEHYNNLHTKKDDSKWDEIGRASCRERV